MYVWWGRNKKKGRGVRGWWEKKKKKKKGGGNILREQRGREEQNEKEGILGVVKKKNIYIYIYIYILKNGIVK